MIDYQAFLNKLKDYPELAALREILPAQLERGLSVERYGDLPRWQQALEALPALPLSNYRIDQSAITLQTEPALNATQQSALKEQLKALHPWRKGPFNFFGVEIDTEWRSDWKWDRLKDHIQPLEDRKVLDVGCGSGYHCWRMRGAGAELVIGIDPTPLFIVQFFALQNYIQDHAVSVLPMGIEHLSEKLHCFDTVFSMGVLYHRRSPFDHLIELRDSLVKGGELILETLVIDGAKGEVLVPSGRYARMGNVWFLPSCDTLLGWLEKVGFKNPRLIDITTTSTEEQRSTEWMTFHSLQQFLDPEDHSKSIEGYPAPKRAIFLAEAP